MVKSFKDGGIFSPIVGKRYEVHFGTISLDGKHVYCSARIKVKGPDASEWEDSDTGKPLDPRIAAHAVQAFTELGCENK